jgi:prepilin-type N-terminal cleavage/methylation domain-containing protein
MRRQQSGFTLVEIAIVLVIIGLLLGGVLKGQELITQAKIKNVANDFNGLTAAVYSYQDRYKRLPGDDPGVAIRWPAIITNPGDGNNKISGSYFDTTTANGESRLFWADLRLAGFVGGDASTLSSAQAQPLNAAGGIIGVQDGGLGLVGLIICSGSLPAKIAQAIDNQFDDGNSKTGSLRGQLDTAPPTAVGDTPADAYVDNGTNLYVICKNI